MGTFELTVLMMMKLSM